MSEDYRGEHQPPDPADSVPLHDLREREHFPRDVYKTLHLYTHTGGREFFDRESVAVVRACRGHPDAVVRIYRAAPDGAVAIEPGNWVALSFAYAAQHADARNESHPDPVFAEHNPEPWFRVYVAEVLARDVRDGGNDLIEWGYHGPRVPASPLTPAL